MTRNSLPNTLLHAQAERKRLMNLTIRQSEDILAAVTGLKEIEALLSDDTVGQSDAHRNAKALHQVKSMLAQFNHLVPTPRRR